MTTYEATVPGDLLSATFDSFASAVDAIVETIDFNPHALSYFDRPSAITDAETGTVIASVQKLLNEYVLIRETTEHKYQDEMYALEPDVFSEWDAYWVFHRWPAS